ncbi:MAG TPA: tRNA (cytidine(34)-2'-O)-methyltransferase [Polyangia bacterium]
MLHLVLVEPEIHWNTGNLGRTALAVGAQLHLVEPLGFSLDDKQVRRAGLDYWPRVAPRIWPSWAALAGALPSLGEAWFFSSAATRPYWDATFADDTVLLFGRESVGLPRELVAAAGDHALAIPMQDPALRSLNLSTAGALAAYEVARQQAARARSRSATPSR